jgi:hypothetical protein
VVRGTIDGSRQLFKSRLDKVLVKSQSLRMASCSITINETQSVSDYDLSECWLKYRQASWNNA